MIERSTTGSEVPSSSLDGMPDDARLWVFASPRPLGEPEEERLRREVSHFVRGWTAHGAPVAGAWEWREGHFLLVAADEAATGVSGCSIDALTRALKGLETALGVSLLDASSRVWYRDDAGAIRAMDRSGFREAVRGGSVGQDTLVFDNTAPTVGALRRGEWERPMRESWHGRAYSGRP
jgi:hypothetical protein